MRNTSRRGIARGGALIAGIAAIAAVSSHWPAVAQAQYRYPPPYRAKQAAPAPFPGRTNTVPAPAEINTAIELIGRFFPGKVGIAVQSTDGGWAAQYNGGIRMPQQSVSKLWVALTVLDQRDSGRIRLDDPITLTRDDLTVFHQPIAALVKAGSYQTNVRDLLVRAMTMSDNTANDRLLNLVGGPGAVREMIARKGLGNIRFGPGERLLQAGTAGLDWKPSYSIGSAFTLARSQLSPSTRQTAFERYVADPPDGAAAGAIAGALARLKAGELLSPESTGWLLSTMESSKTGKARLRGAVPAGWTFGHKTGTGQDLNGRTAGYNDVGVLTAPDGRSYAVAVMIGDTTRPIPERQRLMQSVVNAVVAAHDGPGDDNAARFFAQ